MTQGDAPLSADLPSDLADLLVHLSRLAQSAANSPLTAAQWTALRYFARANPVSRTPSAFSEFHATTRGTASQTVRALVDMGLLARHADDRDRRSAKMEVTKAGHDMLAQDPLGSLRKVLAALPQAEQATLARTVRHAVTELATARGAPVFGTCSDCNHCDTSGAQAYCHCTQTLLAAPDMAAFCVDFRPAAGADKA
ncbi:MarR family winged helix-turn-helix transcriptional regulator [Roseibaca sp. Y0-43]|uniref:MarR family winged helix-turn-helix transcriptional regulator n=1 Tax=Roseibaca sp. Y0-43 TaxID=2816854 RepID=UPI001D0C523D|nr:MarR family transcriptional regulator [Roseibaca sp. Y0-43]MCC1480771.1 MarR family transcriptional regulator [Roseibaca sp. Y0-43]